MRLKIKRARLSYPGIAVGGMNCAPTRCPLLPESVQVGAEPKLAQSPDQPANVAPPEFGVAVSVMPVPLANTPLQFAPPNCVQLIPDGDEVTVPWPDTVSRAALVPATVNVAPTLTFAPSVMTQAPVPEQAPFQPPNVAPVG